MAKSLAAAVGSGDQAEALCALRDRLAAEIDMAEQPRDVAVLSARLVDVLTQIAAIKPAEESVKDDLARKRDQRRAAAGKSGAADSAGSSGGQ